MTAGPLGDRLAEQVRVRRTRMGFTQDQLAARITNAGAPLHSTAVTRIERNQRNVSATELIALVQVLGLSMDELSPAEPAPPKRTARSRSELESKYAAEVRAGRVRLNWSQQDLADRMRELNHAWSQATVWSVETNRRPLRLSEGLDLQALLGISFPDSPLSQERLELVDRMTSLCSELREVSARLG